MSKDVWRLEDFTGGLNDNSDPKDIDSKELIEATNITLDKFGQIKSSGRSVRVSDDNELDNIAPYIVQGELISGEGFSVLNLESGDYEQKNETHPLNEVVYKKSTYNSSTNGRFRCLGGTSTRWGAALLPFLSK